MLGTSSCDLRKITGSDKAALPDQPIVTVAPGGGASDAPRAAPAAAAAPQTAEAPAAAQPSQEAAAGTSPTPAAAGSEAAASGESRLSGTINAQNRASLAFKVGGFLDKIIVQPGQTCRKGQVLATLDPRDYKRGSDMAAAQLEQAKIALSSTEKEFAREEALYKEKATTDSNFDRVKATLDRVKIELRMAEIRYRQASEALADTSLRAPFDCVVTKKYKNEHENVGAGAPVLDVYGVSDLEFQFEVPERLLGKIKVGDKIEVRVPASGFSATLPVNRIVPVVAATSRTFQIIVAAPEGDAKVAAGLFAEAIIK
jgi:RND family efflux transporter MFP subunit